MLPQSGLRRLELVRPYPARPVQEALLARGDESILGLAVAEDRSGSGSPTHKSASGAPG
jgi:hypothetical protein